MQLSLREMVSMARVCVFDTTVIFFLFELTILAVNWYRTRKVNYEEELAILGRRIEVPVLFIQALRDPALPPHLGKSMSKHIPNLTLKQVNTAHWALWEKPEEVNVILEEWLKGTVFAERRVGKL